MTWAERVLRRADGWLFAPGDARRLAAIRIGLCGALAWRLATVDFAVAARRPDLFQPRVYMQVFSGTPSPGLVAALQVCGVAAAVLAAAGLVVRASLPAAFACALFLEGLRNSAGRIIVGDALLLLCLLVLIASSSAADTWVVRRPGTRGYGVRYGWPVRTAMVLVALSYLFAGLQKWRHAGASWFTSGNLRWILYASSDRARHPNHLALFVAGHPLLAHVLAAGALLLETTFVLVLFLPRLRWVYVPGVVALHAGIWLAMGLNYSAQLLTVVIVFVDWPALLAPRTSGVLADAAT